MSDQFGRPLYVQIADDLRRDILQGQRPPGSPLPSISELVDQYQTSTTTIRQAINVLRSEGLVFGRQGKGTFVREVRAPSFRVLGDLYSGRPKSSPLAARIEEAGRTPRWDHRSARSSATESIAERLGIASGDPVMQTDYLFFADEHPVMLWTSFEPLAITGGTPIEYPDTGEATGVVARFDSIGLRIDSVVEDVTARAPRPPESSQLLIPPGVPVMSIERTYASADLTVETADIVVSADRYVLRYAVTV